MLKAHSEEIMCLEEGAKQSMALHREEVTKRDQEMAADSDLVEKLTGGAYVDVIL